MKNNMSRDKLPTSAEMVKIIDRSRTADGNPWPHMIIKLMQESGFIVDTSDVDEVEAVVKECEKCYRWPRDGVDITRAFEAMRDADRHLRDAYEKRIKEQAETIEEQAKYIKSIKNRCDYKDTLIDAYKDDIKDRQKIHDEQAAKIRVLEELAKENTRVITEQNNSYRDLSMKYKALEERLNAPEPEIESGYNEKNKFRKSKKDLFWCSEGCGFVDENHRCEQWTNIFRIPYRVIELLKGRKGT